MYNRNNRSCAIGARKMVFWASSTTEKDVGLIENLECPVCGATANFRVFKQKTSNWAWLIPWWSTKYFATCGNCFGTVKLDKKRMQEIESTATGRKKARMNYEQTVEQGRVVQATITCANCGSQSASGCQFCGTCGARLVTHCPHCGASVPPGYRFCGACGTRIV